MGSHGAYVMYGGGRDAQPEKLMPLAKQVRHEITEIAQVDYYHEYDGRHSRDLLGYNVYRDAVMINAELVENLYYLDLAVPLGSYTYTITSVYDGGESDPSIPVMVDIVDVPALETPFVEGFDSEDFQTHLWVPDPIMGGHWSLDTADGNPAPSAEFRWFSGVDYQETLTSHDIDCTGLTTVDFTFEVSLSNWSSATLEQMAVEVWDGAAWNQVALFDNAGDSFDYISTTVDITAMAAGNAIKVRFVAFGEDAYNINYWWIDNIYVGEPIPYGSLSGTVTDSDTGDPIVGAVVTAGEYNTATAGDGTYMISDMLIGDYDVNCSATNYIAADPVTATITDGGNTVVDFALVPQGGEIFFFDDFEEGSDNWVLEDTWGVTDSLHDSPDGNYGANLNISATLATPWDLSGVLDATLTFYYLCDIETAFDYMYLEVTSDGETWLNLATYDIEDMEEFVQEEIAMGGFVGAGYEAVQIRFRFESDGGYEVNGMYIDDVLVNTSMEDNAPPFIVHAGPEFYEGVAEDYVFTAEIVDVSGIAGANVVYTLDGGEEMTAPYTSVDGNIYTFTIPAQEAGVQVDYGIEATDASDNSNVGLMDGYVYIAGDHFIYDNGVVDFYTVIAEGTGAAVRIDNPAGLSAFGLELEQEGHTFILSGDDCN